MEEKKNAAFAEESSGAEVVADATLGNTAAPNNKASNNAAKSGKGSSGKGSAKGASQAKGSESKKGTAKSSAKKSTPKSEAAKKASGGLRTKSASKDLREVKELNSAREEALLGEELAESKNERNIDQAEEGFITADTVTFSVMDVFDEDEALAIERDAIASLPMAEVEPELLLCDTGEIEDTRESAEEAARYEEYLKDYKEVMAQMLRTARESCDAREDGEESDTSQEDSEACTVGEESDTSQEDSAACTVGENEEASIACEADYAPQNNGETYDEACEMGVGSGASREDCEADDEVLTDGVSDVAEEETFDPLSTISLLEYVPSLLGKDTDEEEILPEDEEDAADAIEADAEDDYAEEYIEQYDEQDEPEQLTMSFDGEDGGEELPDKNVYNKEKPRGIDSLFDLIELFVLTFAAIMVITTFFFRHSVIDGRSMQNTLFDGDVVIISNFLYTPERGDIVVLDDRNASSEVLVKRVIAIEGDTVSIKADGRVYLNGKLLLEDYVYESNKNHIYKEHTWVLGEGEIFVLGDHRNVSEDSEDFGPVSVDSVLGKVLFRLLPFDSFGGLD